MSEILQETTIWTGHYGACNHTYLLDNQNKIIAYIKQNDTKVNILKTQIKIDKRYRTFVKVRNIQLERLSGKSIKDNTRVFNVQSNTKVYNTKILYTIILFLIILLVSFFKLLKINEQLISSKVEFSCVFCWVTLCVVKFEILKSVLENSNSVISPLVVFEYLELVSPNSS